MIRTAAAAATFAFILSLAVTVGAHSGHAHKVMGTVAAVTATQLDVTTTDGKTVVVVLNAKTTFKQGTAKADAGVLKVGERVVVSALQPTGSKTLTATSVQVAKAPAAIAAK